MFPGAGAEIFTNDDGEVLGWDHTYYDDADHFDRDPDDFDDYDYDFDDE